MLLPSEIRKGNPPAIEICQGKFRRFCSDLRHGAKARRIDIALSVRMVVIGIHTLTPSSHDVGDLSRVVVLAFFINFFDLSGRFGLINSSNIYHFRNPPWENRFSTKPTTIPPS